MTPRETAPVGAVSRVRPVEWLLVAYLGITSAIALARLAAQPAIAWVLLANGLCLGLIAIFALAPLGPIGRVLRELYPLLLLGALYPAIDILNRFGGVPVFDGLVRGWELRLFGEEISRTWWQQAPSRFWSTVLHGAYFAYYPIILGPPAVLLGLGRTVAARRGVTWVMATFLLCYLAFVLFPVAGPYYEFPRPAAWFLDNPAARLVYATLARGSAYGAAFPSSHVAATLVATAAAFRGARWLGWVLLGPAILLTVGVVYCQMHYAVDALAGVAVAALVVGAAGLRERREGGSASPAVPPPA